MRLRIEICANFNQDMAAFLLLASPPRAGTFQCDGFCGWPGRCVSGILAAMKQSLAVLVALLVCGCASSNQRDQEADGAYPGAEVAHILAAPTRVEGWNFVRPDGTIITDPRSDCWTCRSRVNCGRF